MPFAVCLRGDDGREHMVGHLNLSNIVRRAFCSAYAGYWIDSPSRRAGGHAGRAGAGGRSRVRHGGLHRIEVNIRPENRPSRRVVEKLGFREEA